MGAWNQRLGDHVIDVLLTMCDYCHFFCYSCLQSFTLAKKKIFFYSCGDKKKQANAAYLIGSYAVSKPACFSATVEFQCL